MELGLTTLVTIIRGEETIRNYKVPHEVCEEDNNVDTRADWPS